MRAPENVPHGSPTDFVSIVYYQLVAHAKRRLARHPLRNALGPEELVHLAWLKMEQSGRLYRDAQHFRRSAGKVIVYVLAEQARHRCADRRPESRTCLALDDSIPALSPPIVDLIDARRSLDSLARSSPDHWSVAVLLAAEGLSVQETARRLRVSPATVKRRWSSTRQWLRGTVRHVGAACHPAPSPRLADRQRGHRAEDSERPSSMNVIPSPRCANQRPRRPSGECRSMSPRRS